MHKQETYQPVIHAEFKHDYMANSDGVAAFDGWSEEDSLRRWPFI